MYKRQCYLITLYTKQNLKINTERNKHSNAGGPGIATALHTVGPCLDHDDTMLVPLVLSTWMPEKVGGLPGQSLIMAETQVHKNSLLSLN